MITAGFHVQGGSKSTVIMKALRVSVTCCLHDRSVQRLPGRPVSTAYTAADWGGFGGAMAGATAALTGLLFVAVSLNLGRILEFPGLPTRAAQTLMLFAAPLFTGLLLIVPGQPAAALAVSISSSASR
jgi:hypothetical protein